MANESMLESLTQLPLFQGVSRERMAVTVGQVRFHFLKYAPGELIARQGDPCTHVRFVISGGVVVSIANNDERFRIDQTLKGPDVICPDFLFGSSTLYPGTVTASDDGEVSIVQITKSEYLKVLASDEIFMFNFLNYLSRNAQKCVEGVLAMTGGSIEERLAMWIVAMTQPNSCDIRVVCKHRDLYAMFGVQRSSFIAALDNLVNMGVIEYEGAAISVLDRRKVLEVLRNGVE